jgi:hypothetical protein
VVGSCEHGNEPSSSSASLAALQPFKFDFGFPHDMTLNGPLGFRKCGKFLD